MKKQLTIFILLAILIAISIDESFAEKSHYLEEIAREEGEFFGYLDGYIEGLNARYTNSKSYFKVILPRKESVLSKYRDELKNKDSDYIEEFYLGYIDGFNVAYKDTYEDNNLIYYGDDLESGVYDGKIAASQLGNMDGADDYFINRNNNYNRNKLTDNEIIRRYFLNRDSKKYKEGFLIGFKKEYEKVYKNSFRKANIDTLIGEKNEAYKHGELAGLNRGKIIANRDYIYGRFDNKRIEDIPNLDILNQYNNLGHQSESYKSAFISGYNEGFTNGYNDNYRNLIKEDILKRTSVDIIPMSGGKLASLDNVLLVNIESGTYYDNVFLSIENLHDEAYEIDTTRYIKASGVYDIQISNSSYILDKNKTIALSFEYYGRENGGIYKLIDGRWIYLSSHIKDNRIITNIKPETLISDKNIYCLFVEKQFKPLTDIYYHWAKDEIDTLVRRDIMSPYKDGRFRPDEGITSMEFIEILRRVYGKSFIDNMITQDKIGLKDNAYMTYGDIENMMAYVLKDENFKWHHISANILYGKQIRSRSYNSIDNRITRAEIAYMIYTLNQWRY